MTLTVAEYRAHIEHALGGTPATLGGLSTAAAVERQIINEAGRYLYTSHPWKFRERPPASLDFSAVSIAASNNATWTESTLTLTYTGGFASFVYGWGAVFTASGGTGVTTGDYNITGKTSDNAITLETSFSTSSVDLDATADITGNIYFPYANLPTDFGELIAIQHNSGLTDNIRLTTFAEIASLRAEGTITVRQYAAAIVQPGQATAASLMSAPRFEIWPTPSAADAEALSVWYRAGWTEIDDDTDVPNIPRYCEGLLVQYCRAFALAYEEEDAGSLNRRLMDIDQGPIRANAVAYDGLMQPNYGPFSGGHIRSARAWTPDINTVSGPS